VINQGINLSVVVPCHNSEITISRTFRTLETILPSFSEIVFVENGSTDQTLGVLGQLSRTRLNKNIQVKIFSSEKGLGNALRAGILETSGEKVAFVADDLPFGSQEIELAALVVPQKKQLFAISKYLPESEYRTSLSRKILGTIFLSVRKRLLNTKIQDTQGSFVGNGDLLRSLAKETKEKEFLITTEIYLLAEKLNIELSEIPCRYSSLAPRPSTVKLRSVTKMAFGLIRLRVRLSNL
jgi:dolichyl-phosphate beta-glucosyltransferase